jgi:syntaxin 1B/2/3
LVKSKFVEAIQNFQQVEQQYRQKYKQRMERQFKIGASPSNTLEFVYLRQCLHFQSSPMRHQKKCVLLSKMTKADKYSLKLCVSLFVFGCLKCFLTLYQLMNSNRYGESRAAYREVQERHEDIKRIERTIAELAQLFNDVRFLCAHYVVGHLTIP